MLFINYILPLLSYLSFTPRFKLNNNLISKTVMCASNNIFNSTKGFTNGLILLNAKDTQQFAISWLYKSMDYIEEHPTFVLADLVSTLTFATNDISKYTLFIGYKPNSFEEPHFISCCNIDPAKRLLCIEQICTNPFIFETSLTKYKKNLKNLAVSSGVLLHTQNLKYLINPRYYLEFSQFLNDD
tara:strand:+ start:68 stop:622 length:555 start_codon:yes stop_codon:yes gene_type:complete